MGICFGDGCLSVNKKKHDYFLQIVANSLDESEYLRHHVSHLLFRLFGLRLIVHKQDTNTVVLAKRSRQLIELLAAYGMPIGKKRILSVPDCILASNELSLAFIRGLFDTDGSLTFKRVSYPTISISSHCRDFLVEIREILLKNDFRIGNVIEEHTTINGKLFMKYRIFLYGKNNLESWFSKIGTNNPKNIIKYKRGRNLNNKEKSRLRDSHPQPLPNFYR